MARGSKFAEAAFSWLKKHAPSKAVSTDELWAGLQKNHPDLTTPSEGRKTPRGTCMRDLRVDHAKRFVVEGRTVRLSGG